MAPGEGPGRLLAFLIKGSFALYLATYAGEKLSIVPTQTLKLFAECIVAAIDGNTSLPGAWHGTLIIAIDSFSKTSSVVVTTIVAILLLARYALQKASSNVEGGRWRVLFEEKEEDDEEEVEEEEEEKEDRGWGVLEAIFIDIGIRLNVFWGVVRVTTRKPCPR
ncbi:hypothetical protein BDFG_08267 [Blastomyces dermatitidis ATCC 26199]|nr:hypothetical protein BDFG_08267 [Blastomyces dermatitidis ATCC 26199]